MFQIGFSFKNRKTVQFRKNRTVKISCLITFLSRPFNYTRICWSTIETSPDLPSVVFGNLRQSSVIFVKCSELFGNVRKRSSGLRNNFGKSSEIFGKRSEIFGKSSKTASLARLHYTLAQIYEFYVLVVRSLVRYSSCHSSTKFIFSPSCNILYD